MFKDTKGIIRIKRTNNDIQNTTQKTKNRATRTSVKPGRERKFSGRERVHVSLVAPVVLPRSLQIPY